MNGWVWVILDEGLKIQPLPPPIQLTLKQTLTHVFSLSLSCSLFWIYNSVSLPSLLLSQTLFLSFFSIPLSYSLWLSFSLFLSNSISLYFFSPSFSLYFSLSLSLYFHLFLSRSLSFSLSVFLAVSVSHTLKITFIPDGMENFFIPLNTSRIVECSNILCNIEKNILYKHKN